MLPVPPSAAKNIPPTTLVSPVIAPLAEITDPNKLNPVTDPVTLKLLPVASPIFGVTKGALAGI